MKYKICFSIPCDNGNGAKKLDDLSNMPQFNLNHLNYTKWIKKVLVQFEPNLSLELTINWHIFHHDKRKALFSPATSHNLLQLRLINIY
jgi:hypothetical protein